MENEKETQENIENQVEDLENKELDTEELDEASGGINHNYLQNIQSVKRISPALNNGLIKGGIICW
jgi:hypothetical protein